jgi:hypothetical protein
MRSILPRAASGAAVLVLALCAGAFDPGALAAAQRDSREQQVVVSVVNRSGDPVEGLTAADFVVREDGVAREVLRVQQASAPMQIVLLVDTSHDTQTLLQDVREGLRALSNAIWTESPDSEILLMEFGERPAQLTPPVTSADADLLTRAVDRLFEHPGSGGYLLEALNEATRLLGSRETARPVIVVFVREGTREFSTLRSQQLEAAVKASRAAVWAIVLQDGAGPDLSDETRQRDIVLGDVTTRSGGSRDILLNRMGIEPEFRQLARRLTSQYIVTYGRPDSLIPPTRLEVTVRRPGARVMASRWTEP